MNNIIHGVMTSFIYIVVKLLFHLCVCVCDRERGTGT